MTDCYPTRAALGTRTLNGIRTVSAPPSRSRALEWRAAKSFLLTFSAALVAVACQQTPGGVYVDELQIDHGVDRGGTSGRTTDPQGEPSRGGDGSGGTRSGTAPG
ncbi:MAG TPA: hypothetical protein VFQ61_06030, partial [Polyangiaceae bacterium]|nr:hypothetical protein [Polyangiaceae bacterium]